MIELQNVKFKKKISIVTLCIGVVGFFVSLYALILHIQGLLQPGKFAFCDINAKVNCSQVIGSSYGELISIPLGSYGMAYFAVIISAAILPKMADVSEKWLAFWELMISVVGLISVATLMYISYFILNLICLTCSTVQSLVLCYAIIKIIAFLKVKKDIFYATEGTFARFFAVALCLGVPPLAAGLVAPIILTRFF